jgi:hypothetical protein
MELGGEKGRIWRSLISELTHLLRDRNYTVLCDEIYGFFSLNLRVTEVDSRVRKALIAV